MIEELILVGVMGNLVANTVFYTKKWKVGDKK